MKSKIQYKLAFVIALIFAVILSGIYHNLKSNLKEQTLSRIRDSLAQNTLLSRMYVESLLSSRKMVNVDDLADQIGNALDLRVTIMDESGVVLGDSSLTKSEVVGVENHLSRPEIQQAEEIGYGESRRFSTTVKKDMLYMAYALKDKDNIGYIRLAIPLTEIDHIADGIRRLLINYFMLAFVMASLIGFVVSSYIVKPIQVISKITKNIADGDFSRRINIKSRDEIEDLGLSINYLTEQMSHRINEIKTSTSKFEAVLMSMFEGVMVIDEKGLILLVNDALRKLLIIDEDPLGKKPLEIVRNIEIQELADKIVRTESGVESREISLLLPKEKTVQIHATPIRSKNNIKGAVMVFHDITELRRLENVRKDFVANVSHEIRTPVTNIKGYAETLLDGALEDKEHAKEFLNIISEDSNRLTQLVDDLLDLSKIESGNLKFDMRPFDIIQLINRIVIGMTKQKNQQDIAIHTNMSDAPLNVKGDEKAIAQVMLNLIDNAIKYNRNNGSVTINVLNAENKVKVEVVDSGIGIPDRDLPRIFERFYRVDKARSRQLGGTGLGLSIAKHIIQAHQSSLNVSSELGRGSTFFFSLLKV